MGRLYLEDSIHTDVQTVDLTWYNQPVKKDDGH